MTASPTLPGVLVRTIAPLLSTAPNMSACVIPADVIPSVIETNLIAFIDSKEGRWRTVFPSAVHCEVRKGRRQWGTFLLFNGGCWGFHPLYKNVTSVFKLAIAPHLQLTSLKKIIPVESRVAQGTSSCYRFNV